MKGKKTSIMPILPRTYFEGETIKGKTSIDFKGGGKWSKFWCPPPDTLCKDGNLAPPFQNKLLYWNGLCCLISTKVRKSLSKNTNSESVFYKRKKLLWVICRFQTGWRGQTKRAKQGSKGECKKNWQWKERGVDGLPLAKAVCLSKSCYDLIGNALNRILWSIFGCCLWGIKRYL